MGVCLTGVSEGIREDLGSRVKGLGLVGNKGIYIYICCLYRDYVGIIFLYSLLRASKFAYRSIHRHEGGIRGI